MFFYEMALYWKKYCTKTVKKAENIAGQCQDKFKSDSIKACLDKCAFAPKQSAARERLLYQERHLVLL